MLSEPGPDAAAWRRSGETEKTPFSEKTAFRSSVERFAESFRCNGIQCFILKEVLMKCANCGETINGTEVFCPYCGERLTGFGQDGEVRESEKRNEEELTFIGKYDEDVYGDPEEDKTYLDRFGGPAGQKDPDEELTRMDSGGISFGEEGSGGFYRGREPSGRQGTYAASFNQEERGFRDRPYQGSFSGNDRQRVMEKPVQKKSALPLIFALLLVLVLLALGAVWFFFFRSSVPEIEDMTCDDFFTEYGFSEDTGDDSIKDAYYDEVVIRFDEPEKSSSSYKVKATVYTPDMEEIYEKSTRQDEVIDRLKRLSDDDLDHEQKLLSLDKKGVLTKGSADSLKDIIEDKYLTAEAYESQSHSGSSVSSGSSAASDSSGARQDSSAAPKASQDQSSASDDPASSVDSRPVIAGVSATSTLYEKNYDHSPGNIMDGKLTTAWVEGVSGYGTGESITLRLSSETLLTSITLHAGYQKSASLYAKNCRPKGITVLFSDGSSRGFDLQDVNAAQTLSLGQVVTDSVTVRIDSVYAGTKYQDTCISEISLN
ncbi:MAG: zinc ribbon domain-containing protein [Firmicutes bacterium]|nr:zinc ribbon domain-containing protein [Bacillota bacterium]